MADGLFDNRYRYDFIYPRGRSGETLRAFDTENNDRPVVIKRPAPNDAPPIRAGQEVSIMNERKALMRLANHPVLTRLLGEGQFFISGMPHQYIAMERADGMIIADEVLELARNGEYLPLLEVLVILDSLLDLLQSAHARDIVYNDVDAKHLFWNRETYRLKLIDWGNAVFLEGDEITPQGISRQSDIFQVGELLVFILTGGRRADVPRDAGPDFAVNLGDDSARITDGLRAIISKALHPNLQYRYKTINDLKRDIETYRAPLEKERDTVVSRVNDRLRQELSKNELIGLLTTLDPAIAADPGNPSARKAKDEIEARLRDLDVEADLDAVRIYIEGDNWSRAADLLNELRQRTGPQTQRMVDLLLDISLLAIETQLPAAPAAVLDAIGLIFDGQPQQAAHLLLKMDNPDDEGRKLQWLIAERISSRVPEVILLRPNLYRLELALQSLAGDGANLSEARTLLGEIHVMLDTLPSEARTNISELRDSYRTIVDSLSTLNQLLSTVLVQRQLPNRKLPLSALDRALNATMALADNMHVIGKQGAASPRDALGALDSSRTIDPINPIWDDIARLLNNLYELLQSYQTYVPTADGADLTHWFQAARKDLTPFLNRLFDEMLARMVDGLALAETRWAEYDTAIIQGNRIGAITALLEASQAVSTISPTLAGWLNQLRSVVDGANYVERHALHGGIGRALADGWSAFDRGRLQDAIRLGQQAQEVARNEVEREAASWLATTASTMRDWVDRSGVSDAKRTEQTLAIIEGTFTEEQRQMRDAFAAQMPSRDTYLKALPKGLIDPYKRSSTSALRAFYCYTILLGSLEAHDNNLEDAYFWRDVAVRTLEENGARHVATQALEEFISRRHDIGIAVDRLNQINGSHAVKTLEATRRSLEENPQARALSPAIHSLRELELAIRDWSDGEFRTAGLKLENAIKAVRDAEQNADIDLHVYRTWLEELQARAAELHTMARQMRQVIERRPSNPQPIIREAHRRQSQVTTQLFGDDTAAQMRQWHETYEKFLSIYTDQNIRRSARLERFNEMFRAMFIDRHPAYPLYQHWYAQTENAPEFPAPPTDEPVPHLNEDEVIEENFTATRETNQVMTPPEPGPSQPPQRNRLWMIVGFIIILLAVAGAFALFTNGNDKDSDDGTAVVTGSTDTPNVEATTAPTTAIPVGIAENTEVVVVEPTVNLPTATEVPPTEALEAVEQVTDTPVATEVPSETPTDAPSETPEPTITDTPQPTPTPTLPEGGLRGWQSLISDVDRLPETTWDDAFFSPSPEGGAWRLGVGQPVDEGGEIIISVLPEMVDMIYGSEAPSRIRRTDTTMALRTYDPLLDTEEVFFGLMLQSVEDPSRNIGVQIQVVSLNILNLSIRENDSIRFVRQVSVNNVLAHLRLERDQNTGNVTAYFNDALIGEPMSFLPLDASVNSALYIRNGGVIVSVTDWRIGLR